MANIIGYTLQCTKCKNKNYRKKKNKTKNPDSIKINKFCDKCKSHTLHKEIKN